MGRVGEWHPGGAGAREGFVCIGMDSQRAMARWAGGNMLAPSCSERRPTRNTAPPPPAGLLLWAS